MKIVLIDVCTACPAKCKYCIHQKNNLGRPALMREDAFEEVIGILAREGISEVGLYMSGEPLLNPVFPKLLASTGHRGFRYIQIATRLSVPIDWDSMSVAFSACAGAKVDVLVTVDTLDKTAASFLYPGIRFELQQMNLEWLAEVKKRHPNVNVVVNSIVSTMNHDKLTEIQTYCNSLGFTWSPRSMGFFMQRFATQTDIDEVKRLVPDGGTGRFDVEGDKVISKKTAPCNDLSEPCPVIGPNGDVTMCCHDMLYEYVVGNILETKSLISILASRRYTDMLPSCRAMTAPFCRGCN